MVRLWLLVSVAIIFASAVFVAMLLFDLAPYLRNTPERYAHDKGYLPRVLVIVPCRGTDINLHRNLLSLTRQSYRRYDIVGVVDSEDDPAASHVRSAGIRLLVSRYAKGNASGKVRAIAHAIRRSGNYDVYAIADSDISVGSSWLSSLVAPLSDRSIGISTMFPRFSPVSGGFWQMVKLVWGFAGEGLMDNKATRFSWGGSMAFRSSLVKGKSLDMFVNSSYSVSDDISITKIAKSKGLDIAYVKKPQPAVYSNDSFSKFVEWSNRQTALSTFGYRKNLYYGIFFYSAELILMVSGFFLSLYVSAAFIVFFLHLAKSEAKNICAGTVVQPADSSHSGPHAHIYAKAIEEIV